MGPPTPKPTDNTWKSNIKFSFYLETGQKSFFFFFFFWGGGVGPEQRGGGSSVFEPLVRGGSSCFYYGN